MEESRSLDVWQGHTVEEWRARWQLPYLRILDSTRSTNDDVRALAATDAPAGSLIIAEHQSAGRGRVGREWQDRPGMSLLFSVLLRPVAHRDPAPGTAPLRIGLALARALRAASGVEIRLKWPNDLVVDDRKVAGILCEAATAGGEMIVVAGVGINVRQRSEDFDLPLRQGATSLEAAGGAPLRRGDVMTSIIDALRPLFRRPLQPLMTDELDTWADLDALAGRAITLTGGAPHSHGTARGIAPDGALLLETGSGTVRVSSATVRPAATHPTTPHRT
jgi:BirA family transcriptional regulator, biotin operon repressor / biotin---[acetyl-CoA-carboxylase] ligase